MQVPAIPSFAGRASGGDRGGGRLQILGVTIEAANSGGVGHGFSDARRASLDGGIVEMLPTISIVILVMAYVGIMQHTGLYPVAGRPHRVEAEKLQPRSRSRR